MKLRASFAPPVALLGLLVSSWSSPLRADDEGPLVIKGTLYEIGSNFEKVVSLYEMRQRKDAEGGLISSHSYLDPKTGKLQVKEVMHIDKSGEAISFSQDHLQLQGKGLLTVTQDKLNFEWKQGGKTKVEVEDREKNLITPAMVIDRIKRSWDKLMGGDSDKIRLAVLDRTETVGFRIDKTEEGEFQGKPAVTFRFKPTSIVIQAIVDPIFLTFDKSTHRLLRVIGRMPVKTQDGDRWRDFDADATYTIVGAGPQ